MSVDVEISDVPIEKTLWEFLVESPKGASVEWLPLCFGAGFRDGSLLKRTADKARTLPKTDVIFVPSLDAMEEEVIPQLGAIGNKLYHLDQKARLRFIKLFRSKIRNTPRPRLARWAVRKLIAAFIVVAVTVCVTFLFQHEYQKFVDFIRGYGLLLLAGGIATWAMPHLETIIGDYRLAGPETHVPSDTDLSDYRPSQLCQRLLIFRSSFGKVVLLIDDVHKLLKAELNLLHKLMEGQPSVPIRIITIGPAGSVKFPKGVECRPIKEPPLGFTMENSADDVEGHTRADKAADDLLNVDLAKQYEWGKLDLLSVCVTDSYEARTMEDWRSVLSTREGSVLDAYLKKNSLAILDNTENLLQWLAGIPLFHADGRSYYRNRFVTSALLRKMDPNVLCEAHLFWLDYYDHNINSSSVELALVHAVEASRMAKGLVDVNGLAGLGAALVRGARLCREKGEVEKGVEALQLTIGILGRLDASERVNLIEDLAAECALFYAVAGVPGPLEIDMEPLGELENSPAWAANLRNIRSLQAVDVGEVPKDEGLRPELQNISRVIATRPKVRLSDWWKRTDVLIPDPVEAPLGDGSELALYALHAQRAIETREGSILAILAEYWSRLNALKPNDEQLGLEAVWLLQRGRYMEILRLWWNTEAEVLKAQPTSSDKLRELHTRARELGLDPTKHLETELPLSAKTTFERCLALSTMLSLKPINLAAIVKLAFLTMENKPGSVNDASSDWWQEWDRLFDVALELEHQLTWHYHEPFIRWYRWHFFRHLDARGGAWDALLFYESARFYLYSDEQLFSVNSEIRDELTGINLPRELEAHLAALWMDWGRLLENPQLSSKIKDPERERTNAFVFAAQSYLGAGKMSNAQTCLAKASDAMNRHWGVMPPFPMLEEQGDRDSLFVFLHQCLRLQEADPHRSIIKVDAFDVWRLLRPGDFYLTAALSRVLNAEQNDLRGLWSVDNGTNDPVNPHLRLISVGPSVATVPFTRFEFRLRQLLGWLTGDSYVRPEGVSARARTNWRRFDNPAKCVLPLARAGLAIPNIPLLDRLIVSLLEEVHHQTRAVTPNDEYEREALECLLRYQPGNAHWKESYLEVCKELEILLEREIKEQQRSGKTDYFKLVLQIHSYLDVFRNVAAGKDFSREQRAQQHAALLREAQALLNAGSFEACWRLLKEYLSGADEHSVTLLDLGLLQAAQTCAESEPSLHEQVRSLEFKLQTQALRYVENLASEISDAAAKELAKRILNVLRRATGATSIAA